MKMQNRKRREIFAIYVKCSGNVDIFSPYIAISENFFRNGPKKQKKSKKIHVPGKVIMNLKEIKL